MEKERGQRGPSGREFRGQAGVHEWVGGRVTLPCYITQGEPYRPDMILWLELPEDLVVGSTLIDPSRAPVSFARTLHQTMRKPMVGPSRRPARIRVADPLLAAEICQAEKDVEVVVAPTPELDKIVKLMAKSMAAEACLERSYLDGGRIPPEVVGRLFSVAQLLFPIAPWKLASDGDLIRLDIPALGVEAACLSIIGALGQVLGFLIFPSLAAFEAFVDAAENRKASQREGPPDLGGSLLSLNFERGADLAEAARREVAEHGWPVAGPDAYPWVEHRDRDGYLRPLTERDYRIVSACAASLAPFFLKHAHLFKRASFPPICESYFDENDLEVRFTIPYEAGPMFRVNSPDKRACPSSPPVLAERASQTRGKISRNAPCFCGSGKKYKKCCLPKD